LPKIYFHCHHLLTAILLLCPTCGRDVSLNRLAFDVAYVGGVKCMAPWPWIFCSNHPWTICWEAVM